MKLVKQIKLLPTKEQSALLDKTMREYISLVNDILDYALACSFMPKLSSASVKASLPAALRDQCRIDARNAYNKALRKGEKIPVFKKLAAVWNNQNYEIGEGFVAMPFFVDGKSRKLRIAAIVPDDVLHFLATYKRGTMRLTQKNGKYIAQIAYEAVTSSSDGENTMGVDLGLKCPAVAVTSDGSTKFYGNGRHNKYVRRRYSFRRKKLGKAKKLNAIRKSKNKEQRWMIDQDHKISRAIVNDAIAHGVAVIKLEKLSGIRRTARTSRKNNRNLHSWSFYRLSQFIEYKAALAGIRVDFVNPAYTSQTCPHCGAHNHANDRNYKCACGYTSHRDRVGAVNILAA